MLASSCCDSFANEFWYRSCSMRSWFCRFHFVRRFWYLTMGNFLVKLFTQSKALTTFLLAFPTDSVDQRLPRDQPPTNIFGIGTSARGKRAANVWTLFAGGDSVSELLCCLRGMCIADFRVAHGACWSICSWTCLQCQYRYPDQRLMSLIKKNFFLRDIWGYKICCCKN